MILSLRSFVKPAHFSLPGGIDKKSGPDGKRLPMRLGRKHKAKKNQEHLFYKPCSVFALQQTMTICLESSLRSFASGLPEKKSLLAQRLEPDSFFLRNFLCLAFLPRRDCRVSPFPESLPSGKTRLCGSDPFRFSADDLHRRRITKDGRYPLRLS